MNRQEAIKVLKQNRIFYRDWKQEEFEEAIATLEKPITLAEFLGWEEDVEYHCYDDKFIIIDNELYIWNYTKRDWIDAYSVSINRFEQLRQAKKVEPKLKAYHVKDEYSYNCLMKELEEQGWEWTDSHTPTEFNFWSVYKNKTIIYSRCDKALAYGSLDGFNEYRGNSYDLIEYHKEEPKFYAKIKNAFNLPLRSPYLFLVNHDRSIRNSKGKNRVNSCDCIYFMTKTEWNKLGINDTNADFEEVEE